MPADTTLDNTPEPAAEPPAPAPTKSFFEVVLVGQNDFLCVVNVYAESAEAVVAQLNRALHAVYSSFAKFDVHDRGKGLCTIWVNPRHVVLVGRPVEPRKPAMYDGPERAMGAMAEQAVATPAQPPAKHWDVG